MSIWSFIALFLLLLLPAGLRGQDIHFSQIDINPILFNPAYSGFFDGTGRFGLVYRNQWASVSSPFQTLAASGEVALFRRRYSRDGLSLGFHTFTDRAGTLHYGTTAGQAILSYFKAFGSGNTMLSAAIEAGYAQSGYDPSEAQFEQPGDNLALYSVHYPLLGAGLALFVQPSDLTTIRLGLSGRNLNRPNISYLGLGETVLQRRLNAYFRLEHRFWPSVSLLPLAAAQFQLNNTELVTGCDAKWYISEGGSELVAFSGGLHYRWLDALMVELALEYNSLVFALNYDANLSKLTPASKSFGSFELQVVYRMLNHRSPRYRSLPCPII